MFSEEICFCCLELRLPTPEMIQAAAGLLVIDTRAALRRLYTPEAEMTRRTLSPTPRT